MRQIISANINWNLHIGNLPVVELTLDNLLDWKGARYEERILQFDSGCKLYISTNDPFCHFLLENPNNKNGYGGADFKLTLYSGKEKVITGPWSSRSSVVNHHFGTSYIDASYKVQGQSLYYPCAVDTRAVIPYLPDEVTFEVNASDRFKDKTFIPTYKGMSYSETKQYLRSLQKR